MKNAPITTARARIADCLQLDERGQLVQRRDHLNLSGLGLTDAELTARFVPQERNLPEIGLDSLPHLRYLDLTGNRLTELPECVIEFAELVWLGLNFNRIAQLPGRIDSLAGLQRLYLRGNALTELPGSVGRLQGLHELDLTGCDIARLPPSLARLQALEHVALEEKSLAPDLRAVWKDKQWASLREHLARVPEDAGRAQFVGKVMLVGSQENGKTCLQRALRGEPFIEGHESTDGMSRERLHLRPNGDFVSLEDRAKTPGPREDAIDLTLWDMGGQESYQHTHQMFFTPSAVYLVVTLPRQGGGIQEIDKWIELVKRRTSGEATIIVVSTWCRKYPADQAVTLAELRAKHGETIRALATVDSQDGSGIPELRKLLAGVVQEPRAKCRHTWLPGWANALNELANSPQAFLRWPAIAELGRRHGLRDDTELRQVIRTGHYIGALLWREDIPAGMDVVILNPDWLCRAVARLLDDPKTRNEHGLVNIPELDRVWLGPGRDGTPGYEPNTYSALIELMEINELAYRPRGVDRRIGEGNLLLLTQMVKDTPQRDVEAAWEAISPKDGAETVRVIAFRKLGSIGYEPVPDLIYLLIFRLREFSLGRTDFSQAVHWQRGLLVRDDYGAVARIESDGTLLRIAVRHRLGDGLMHSIVSRIGARNDGYWNGRGLEKAEFVPFNHICAKGSQAEGLISMDDIAEAVGAGNQSVRCELCRKYVSIKELLSMRASVPPDLQAICDQMTRMEKNLAALIGQEGAVTREAIAGLEQFIRQQGDGILEAFISEWKDGPRLFSLIPIRGKISRPKDWTEMQFRVTIWCEASRRPVPLFCERKDGKSGEFRGSETITLQREWVRSARKLLRWGSWAAYAAATGGAGLVGGLVTAAGGVITQDETSQLAEEYALQRESLEDFAGAIPDKSEPLLEAFKNKPAASGAGGFGSMDSLGFGALEEGDLKLIRFLREEYKKKDPTWGGLEGRRDDKFGLLWTHPKSKPPVWQ